MTKVLVTGGSGFIGSVLVRHLLAAGFAVRVLARHKHNPLLEGLDVEIIKGDIVYPDSVERAASGVTVILNLASIYTFYPFWDKQATALYKINVQGTRNVLAAALRHKVERFVHTSTIATIGRDPDGRPSTEETGLDLRSAIHYARSKYLAEQEVWQYCAKGLPAIVLNPAIVLGERDYKPTPSGEVIVKFLNRIYPAYFEATWSVADVDDVAEAHIAAIEKGRVGERYILCNKKHYSMQEIFFLLEKISGIKSPHWKIPYFLLYPFAYLDEFLSYRFLHKKPLMATEGIRFCRQAAIYDNTKAVKELGYAPTPIEETLKKAVNWFRMHDYVLPQGSFRIKAQGSKRVVSFMKRIGMDRYTDRLNLDNLFFYYIVRFLQFLRKKGFAARGDGWRMVTECYLRSEHAKFSLAVFRLDLWSDAPGRIEKTFAAAKEQVMQRLAEFFKEYPLMQWQLDWQRFCVKRAAQGNIDLVAADFEKDGQLKHLKLYLDKTKEGIACIDAELNKFLGESFIAAYNQTRSLADEKRPPALKNKLISCLGRFPSREQKELAKRLIQRLLGATWINFEILPADQKASNRRFACPAFIKFKHPGFGFLNLLCRLSADFTEADFWFQFSHIPQDGVPMQEILHNLKRHWGTCGELSLPTADYKKRLKPEICSAENNKNGIYHIDEFIDFRPLLKLRRELNKKYAGQLKGSVTLASLFIWRLAHYGVFAERKFSVPVDLKATARHERTLGFVFIRPSMYFDRQNPERGFLKFQAEFNRQLRATWKRESPSYKLLDCYALLPPEVYALTLKTMPWSLADFVGTVGITIIKKADLFIAPYSDVHKDGFIAISNFLVKREDGSKVCNISIKAPKNKIQAYLEAVEEVASQTEA